MTDELGPDPWEERLQFGELFLRHLEALGRPFISPNWPPMTIADYLEMLEVGEMLAEYDQVCSAPDYYRDTVYVHRALIAGATWAEVAGAVGSDEAAVRQRYRAWAEEWHQQGAGSGRLDDDEYAAAIKRAEGETGGERDH